MSRYSQKETLFTGDYIDNDGDVRSPDDNPEGFEAVGYTPKGSDYTREDAVTDEYDQLELEIPENEQLGVHVSLGMRATNLLAAIDAFSHVSMLQGFLRSNNRKKIIEYGGEEAISRAISRSNERGSRALRAGTGIDAMLASPDLVPDADGTPYDEGLAANDLAQYKFAFRDSLTAYGTQRLDSASAKEKVDKQKQIERNRATLRRQLAQQIIHRP